MNSVDTSTLSRTLAAYGALAKKTAAEVVRDVAKRFSKQIVKQTPPLFGGKKRADHTAFLKHRILEMRLPRGKLTRAMMRTRHMSKAQARAYYRVAMARQGELISGWNAVARASGIKTPAWISRHGEKHGTSRERVSATGAQITASFSDNSKNGRTDIRRIAERAVKRVESGLRASAEHILRKRLKKS